MVELQKMMDWLICSCTRVRQAVERIGVVAHLGKQCVQTMDLLSLFDVGVVLCDATKGQFIHEVNLIGLLHVLLLKIR